MGDTYYNPTNIHFYPTIHGTFDVYCAPFGRIAGIHGFDAVPNGIITSYKTMVPEYVIRQKFAEYQSTIKEK